MLNRSDGEGLVGPSVSRVGGRPAFLNPWLARGGAAVVLAALVLPPHGLGIPMCWLDATTGIPCPGCGLTRSVTCVAHLRFAEAWGFHPFGFVVFGVVLALALGNFVPASSKPRIAAWLSRYKRVRTGATWAFLIAFFAFGLARAVAQVVSPGLFTAV